MGSSERGNMGNPQLINDLNSKSLQVFLNWNLSFPKKWSYKSTESYPKLLEEDVLWNPEFFWC